MPETAQNKTESIVYRGYKEEDKNFILATWLRGLYYGDAGYIGLIPKDVFMSCYHRILESLLTRPDTFIRVACLEGDNDTILGYSVSGRYEHHVYLHWVFVKTPFRKMGIARGLVSINVSSCTHLSKVGISLLKKYPQIVFNPFK